MPASNDIIVWDGISLKHKPASQEEPIRITPIEALQYIENLPDADVKLIIIDPAPPDVMFVAGVYFAKGKEVESITSRDLYEAAKAIGRPMARIASGFNEMVELLDRAVENTKSPDDTIDGTQEVPRIPRDHLMGSPAHIILARVRPRAPKRGAQSDSKSIADSERPRNPGDTTS